jgi:hypothetical protein
MYVVLLHFVRKPILNRTPSPLSLATGFLTRDYKSEYYYWEAVELSRRIVLTGWVALINEKVAFIRIVMGVLTSLSILLLTLGNHLAIT